MSKSSLPPYPPPALTSIWNVEQSANRFFVWLARHLLAWLLLIMLLFVLLPFLAPLLMSWAWSAPATAIYQFYAFFCHQLPQRSWFLFGEKLTYSLPEIHQVFPTMNVWELRSFVGTPEMGWKVAWSDRMISFYTMIPIIGLFYVFPRRKYRPISRWFLLLALLPLFIDGTTHALNDLIVGMDGNGFRDSNMWLAWLTNYALPGFYAGDHFGTFNWWVRLSTGIVAAWGLAAFFFPWLYVIFNEPATI